MVEDQKTLDLIKRLDKKVDRAKKKRATFENMWQQIADVSNPEVRFTGGMTPGETRRGAIFDDTALHAAQELASAFDGMMTNTSIRWFALASGDPSYKPTIEEQQVLYESTTVLLSHFDSARSMFTTAAAEMYLDYVTYGTGIFEIVEKADGIRYKARFLGEMYLCENDCGEVTEWHRIFDMPGDEVIETFGLKNIDEDTRSRIMKSDGIEVRHCLYKRYENDDTTSKPIASIYYLPRYKLVLKVGGLDQSPFLTPRFSKMSGEVYGRSPFATALPSIRSINSMARSVMEAGELAVRPPLFVPANGIEGSIKTSPGSIIYVRAGTREFPKPMETGARPDFGEKEIERRAARIDRAFMADRLRLPDNDRMTAYEISARQRQGLLTTSPIIGRLITEFVNPVVTHAYEWFRKNGKLKSLPEGSRLKSVGITYTSPLIGSRSSAVTQAWENTIMQIAPLADRMPEVLDILNADEAVKRIAEGNHLDPNFLNSKSDVDRKRKERAAMMKMAQDAEIAAKASGAVKNLAQSGAAGAQ